jgi:hypothetical protein
VDRRSESPNGKGRSLLCKTELHRVRKARCLRASILSDQEVLAEELLSDRLTNCLKANSRSTTAKAFIGKTLRSESESKHARYVDSGQLKNFNGSVKSAKGHLSMGRCPFLLLYR